MGRRVVDSGRVCIELRVMGCDLEVYRARVGTWAARAGWQVQRLKSEKFLSKYVSVRSGIGGTISYWRSREKSWA